MNLSIEDIYNQTNIECYDIKLQYFIKDIISMLYYSGWEPLTNIQIEHIYRAIFKYTEAKKCRKIYNTKKYFASCLRSAIKETELDSLY
ncbi:MAG: hypothetical protein ABF289_04700 [Clostridiales bacterium]